MNPRVEASWDVESTCGSLEALYALKSMYTTGNLLFRILLNTNNFLKVSALTERMDGTLVECVLYFRGNHDLSDCQEIL